MCLGHLLPGNLLVKWVMLVDDDDVLGLCDITVNTCIKEPTFLSVAK